MTFAGRLRPAWRATGLMVIATAAATIAAVVVHLRSNLPARYTWFQPLRTLFEVAGQPWLVVAGVAAFGLGRLRLHRGPLPRASLRGVDPRRLARVVALALVLVVTDVVLFPDHTPLDRLAWCVAAWAIAWPGGTAQIRRAAREAAVVTPLFLAICYAYTIWKAVLFVGRTSMDPQILAFEHAIFGVIPHRALAAWSAERPWFVHLCDWVYFQFFTHMALTVLLLAGMRRARMRLEYSAALGICYLLGGPLYHLVPAAGPVFVDPRAFDHLWHMPLMANRVRPWLFQNTADVMHGTAHEVRTWGYIACMPSLHVAHETVMVWYARKSRPALLLSLAFAIMTCVAVVTLGWHYPSDAVAGIALGAIAIAIVRVCRGSLFPAFITPPDDPPLPE